MTPKIASMTPGSPRKDCKGPDMCSRGSECATGGRSDGVNAVSDTHLVAWESHRDVRAGNPAVVGTRARRPEALRPHLSVSLPCKRGLLCIAVGTSASRQNNNL